MREKTCVCGDGDQSDFVGLLCYTAIMPRRRKSRRSILERFMPVRASDFCNENLGDCFCGYPPPFAWPFMQKLRASRARVWFEHKTSGLLHKLGFQWTRCNFGGRRPWFICQCGKRVAKLYDTGSQLSRRPNIVGHAYGRGPRPTIRRLSHASGTPSRRCRSRAQCSTARRSLCDRQMDAISRR